MNEKAVICMPSKNLSVAMYWVQHYYKNLDDHLDGCQSYFISTSKNFEISQIFSQYPKKTFKMSAKSKKQESQELVSDEESGSEYECSDSGEESDEEMEVSEESEVDEDLVVVSNLFIII